MTTIDNVRSKLYEYGIEIFSEYHMEDEEYCFQNEKMMVFVNEKESSICVSFMADMRPEESSNYLLIINEIEKIKRIDVTESYTFDQDNQFITGEEAFDFVKKNIISEVVAEYSKHQLYDNILNTSKCFNC